MIFSTALCHVDCKLRDSFCVSLFLDFLSVRLVRLCACLYQCSPLCSSILIIGLLLSAVSLQLCASSCLP